MRAITGGSLVLAFAAVLMSWDASRRFTHVQVLPLVASFETAAVASSSPTALLPVIGPRELESPKPAVVAPDPKRAESANAAGPSRQGVPLSVPDAASRLSRVPAGPVRQFTPGSKAHAEAIASSIASNEYRNTVEPLARLYFAFFDRVADYEGLNYYIDERDAGVSLESIASDFAGSLEFRLRYGTLDNAAFVDRIYRNVFDAPPDSAQRAYWVGQLDAGMNRGNVILAFSESGAFRTATTNEVFVTLAYAETLRQAPDAAGFARWVRFLDAGNPREAVIAGLLGGKRKTR